MTQKMIAASVGCSPSTISRELRRGSGARGYTYRLADELAQERASRSFSNAKVKSGTMDMALSLLRKEQWSPRQISGALAKEGLSISHETIYKRIRADTSGELKKNCRHKMKYRRHQPRPYKTAGRSMIPNRTSIHERPPIADDASVFGNWEMDLIIGKGQKSGVLTLVERKTNFFLQHKIKNKKPDHVAKVARRLLMPFKGHIVSITTDNGVEFSQHEWLTKMIGARVYFADPYCSGQKGAVENGNKLFRQYYPKGTDFNDVSQQQLDAVSAKINRRPREKLGYSTPVVEFFKWLNQIALAL